MKKTVVVATLALVLAGWASTTIAQGIDFGLRLGANMTRLRAYGFDVPGQSIDGRVFNRNEQASSAHLDGEDRSSWQWRPVLGLYGRVKLGNFGIQPELNLNWKGGREEHTALLSAGTSSDVIYPQQVIVNGAQSLSPTSSLVGSTHTLRQRYEHVYAQVPILARYEFLKVIKPYVYAGPAFGFSVFANYNAQRLLVDANANTVSTDTKGYTLEELGADKDGNNRIFNVEAAPVEVSFVCGAGVTFPFGLSLDIRYDLGLTDAWKFTSAVQGFSYSGQFRNRTLTFSIAKNLF